MENNFEILKQNLSASFYNLSQMDQICHYLGVSIPDIAFIFLPCMKLEFIKCKIDTDFNQWQRLGRGHKLEAHCTPPTAHRPIGPRCEVC